MLKRIMAGLYYGWHYRKPLRVILQKASTLQQFASTAVPCIVLDIDGVLTPHGVDCPSLEICEWLQNLPKEASIFLLSNNMFAERRAWFEKNFPRFNIVTGVAKKPSPDGLHRIMAMTALPPESLILLDDRLLTGGLAALRAGTQFYLIKPALRDFKQHYFKESFFSLLRAFEQQMFK